MCRFQVSYDTGDLIDDDNRGVMMAWEGPLMVEHAKRLCAHAADCRPEGGDVMNIGFGMGLIDTAIQELKPRSHTIIEAHPQVSSPSVPSGALTLSTHSSLCVFYTLTTPDPHCVQRCHRGTHSREKVASREKETAEKKSQQRKSHSRVGCKLWWLTSCFSGACKDAKGRLG